jgi:hypothetical protein
MKIHTPIIKNSSRRTTFAVAKEYKIMPYKKRSVVADVKDL